MHSKLTLAILLVVLMCQVFATSSAFSVQYPGGEHPMGFDVNHHHFHGVGHGVSESRDSAGEHRDPGHEHGAFNATEPVDTTIHFQASQTSQDYALQSNDAELNSSLVSEALETEHEHANHSHTPSHPPVDAIFMSGFFQSETLIDDDISYLNLRYAPPIPPPHA
ncbi:hypothetical protein [Shewanella atlantica]|uniref:Cobalt transporter n=1 Tax=Shewanella atlantica TaxID=271099 RepID=A0A431VY89_9GAMM|nr:hypothetical protein [Shewanella atlantica]RTR28257.1 hypothetical protein EKG39_19195 [Shewanella atlantica]